MRLLVYGINTIKEAALSGALGRFVYVSRKKLEKGSIDKKLLEILKKKNISLQPKNDPDFIREFGKDAYIKGIAAIADYSEASYEDIVKVNDKKPFYLILDEITDPQNFGAIIRTADCVGVTGIIVPKSNSINITPSVANVSQGAVFYTPVSTVVNISRTIDDLKKRGVWVFGLSNEGRDDIYSMDFDIPVALVVGSEGKGLRRLTSSKCEKILKIPMTGRVNSLNASVSFAVAAYEVLRQRLAKHPSFL